MVPDLPGYGGSRVAQDSDRWTKRHVANAVAALMSVLRHETFAVIGHDRGARVGYRLALDHPDRLLGFASLTVIPTIDVWSGVDKAFGMRAFHWFLLAQPYDLPERLLSADPDAFIDADLGKSVGKLSNLEPEVVEAYRAAFREPAVRHAMCEDYRAAASEDIEHDTADHASGHKLACPVLILCRQLNAPNPIEVWRRWADDVTGNPISGSHLQPELSSREVLKALEPFLARVTNGVDPGKF